MQCYKLEFAMAKDDDGAVDTAVIRCLDSVDGLLHLRHAVNSQLAEGWMEMARARYAMGPSRINESLFSLRPHSALISVREGENSRLELDIMNKNLDKERTCANQLQGGTPKAQTEQIEDSDDDESVKEMLMYKKKVDPLYWFGNLVSPHLRTSQQCFRRALETLLELANSQKVTIDAHCQAIELYAKTTADDVREGIN